MSGFPLSRRPEPAPEPAPLAEEARRDCPHDAVERRWQRIGGVRVIREEAATQGQDAMGGVDENRWFCSGCGEEFVPRRDVPRLARGQRYRGQPGSTMPIEWRVQTAAMDTAEGRAVRQAMIEEGLDPATGEPVRADPTPRPPRRAVIDVPPKRVS